MFRKRKVTRARPWISRSQVLTSTACQGRTMRRGVIVGAGCKDDETRTAGGCIFYAMLSRATAVDSAMMIQDPGQ
eukprot:202419-Pyramimonas_sp.AAC.1